MSALSGFVTGVLGLTLLEAVISSDTATQNATGAFSTAAKVVRQLASPMTPGIPDLRPGVAAGTAPSSTSSNGFNQPGSRLPVAT